MKTMLIVLLTLVAVSACASGLPKGGESGSITIGENRSELYGQSRRELYGP